jgi:hypothetical protein
MPFLKAVASATGQGYVLLVLGSLCAALLLLAACGGDDEPEFPLGAFISDKTGSEYVFLEDGKWTATIVGADVPIENGEYELDGDQITFNDPDLAPTFGCDPEFVYTWSFDGEVLDFEVVEDDPRCSLRTDEIDGSRFVLQS